MCFFILRAISRFEFFIKARDLTPTDNTEFEYYLYYHLIILGAARIFSILFADLYHEEHKIQTFVINMTHDFGLVSQDYAESLPTVRITEN